MHAHTQGIHTHAYIHIATQIRKHAYCILFTRSCILSSVMHVLANACTEHIKVDQQFLTVYALALEWLDTSYGARSQYTQLCTHMRTYAHTYMPLHEMLIYKHIHTHTRMHASMHITCTHIAAYTKSYSYTCTKSVHVV